MLVGIIFSGGIGEGIPHIHILKGLNEFLPLRFGYTLAAFGKEVVHGLRVIFAFVHLPAVFTVQQGQHGTRSSLIQVALVGVQHIPIFSLANINNITNIVELFSIFNLEQFLILLMGK